MPEVICNTSPMQYLHQVGLLHLLPQVHGNIVIPTAVADELAEGRGHGVSLPDVHALSWVMIRQPSSLPARPLPVDLGRGEMAVLALALEAPDPLVILDDALARQAAESLGLRITGTLGVLLKAKSLGLLDALSPILDQLQAKRFRVNTRTRAAVLKLAGE